MSIRGINPNLMLLAVLVVMAGAGYVLSGNNALLGRMAESGFSALLGAGAFAGVRAVRGRKENRKKGTMPQ